MSAFVVGKPHIDALVTVAHYGPAGVRWEPLRHGFILQDSRAHLTDDQLGHLLWLENHKSVSARYPDFGPGELPGPIDFVPAEIEAYQLQRTRRAPTLIEAFKLIACYEYQSCEHAGWRDSAAYRFCEQLRAALIRRLPGYDEAPWEWED